MSHSTPPSTSIRLTQAASILLSSLASGGGVALSALLVPRLLESPTPLMLRQWANSHRVTRAVFPALGNLSTALYLGLAYAHRARARGLGLYLSAGALCLAVTPYTWAFVLPLNRRILRKAEEMRGLEGKGTEEVDAMGLEEEGVGPKEEGAKWLVDQWGVWNLGRGVAWGLAAMLGLAATV